MKTPLDIIQLQIEERRRIIHNERRTLKRLYVLKTKMLSGQDVTVWVPTSALAYHIKEWLDEGHQLIELSRMINMDFSALSKIRDCKYKRTRDDVADRILTAIGKSQLLGEEVPLIDIPMAPETKYYEE